MELLRRVPLTEEEESDIYRNYTQARRKTRQVQIEAQLHLCPVSQVEEIIARKGNKMIKPCEACRFGRTCRKSARTCARFKEWFGLEWNRIAKEIHSGEHERGEG